MPFGVVSGIGQGMGVLDGVVIIKGKGQFWGEVEASHCNHLAFATWLFSNYFEDLYKKDC